MIRALAVLCRAVLCLAGPAAAAPATLPLPEPGLVQARGLSSERIATGPYAGGLPSVVAEGDVIRRIWDLGPAGTTLAILDPLRAALEAQGWKVVFACETVACGGFDFRFEIDVTPAPEMFVDLADYRYLAARKDDAWIALIVSRSVDRGYVQVTQVEPGAAPASVAAPAPLAATGEASDPNDAASPDDAPDDTPAASTTPPTSGIAEALTTRGHAVLPGLDFATGSATLEGQDYPALAALAAYLADRPGVTIALVGHTDASGSGPGNLAVSRRRADSARALLTGRYGVDPARVTAQGFGSYAPIARNDTEAGRRRNRRVEAVVTSPG